MPQAGLAGALGALALGALAATASKPAPGPVSAPARRLVVSFVVGLEGTGHHWYYAFWAQLAALALNEVACDQRLACRPNSSAAMKDLSDLVERITTPEPNSLEPEAALVRQLAVALAETVRSSPSATGLGVWTCSFHCGGKKSLDERYGPGRWPKLVALARAVQMASAALAPGIGLEPAFLVLERSPIESVISFTKHRHMRRGALKAFDNIAGMTRLMRDQRAILENELALLLRMSRAPATPVRIAVANFSAPPLDAAGLACLMQLSRASVRDALVATAISSAATPKWIKLMTSASHGSELNAAESAYVLDQLGRSDEQRQQSVLASLPSLKAWAARCAASTAETAAGRKKAAGPARSCPLPWSATHECTPATPCRGPFPRVLHLLWPTRDFVFAGHAAETEEAGRHVGRLRQLNPGWELRVWTDEDCERLMRSAMPDRLRAWRDLTPKMKRFDAIRPLILHVYGGIYLDVDVECARPFDPLLADRPTTALLLRAPWKAANSHQKGLKCLKLHDQRACAPGCASPPAMASGNNLMGGAARHPLWLYYLDQIYDRKLPPQGGELVSVATHTGNGALERAVFAFLADHPSHRGSVRLLAAHEMQNTQLGQADCGYLVGENYSCSRLACRHVKSLSPVEIQEGGDDNAAKQRNLSRLRNLRLRGAAEGGGGGGGESELQKRLRRYRSEGGAGDPRVSGFDREYMYI